MRAADPQTTINLDGVLAPDAGDPERTSGFLPTGGMQAHAAFLLRRSNGDLCCAWFGGSDEGQPDVSIYFSRLGRRARQWASAIKVSGDPERSEQNPVLFEAPSGDLWLLYTAQTVQGQDTALVRRTISRDGGLTWSKSESLFDDTGVFIRQPITLLDNGDWLLPIFYCRAVDGERWHGHNDISAVRISGDSGKTWREYPVPASLGAVHMNVVHSGGRLLAFFRDRYAENIKRSISEDNGKTWSEPKPISLPNNNSSIQITALTDGTLAMVYNDARATRAVYSDRSPEGIDYLNPPTGDVWACGKIVRRALWGIPRTPLTLALSADGGDTWFARRDLEISDGRTPSDPTAKHVRRQREISYPVIVEGPPGQLNIAYTYFRQGIKFVQVPTDWVLR